MTSLRCHEWDKHQSYRRDRAAPPWIKVHRNLMQSSKWASLTDSEKGQLVSIWLLAADRDGEVPSDPFLLKKICMLDEEPNIEKFIQLRFLTPTGRQRDVKMTPTRQPNDAPEAEEIREERPNGPAAKPPDPAVTLLAELKTIYPKRNGSQRWPKAEQYLRTRLKEGADPQAIKVGVKRYAAWCEASEKIGTETVMQAATFFGAERGWENDWTPPAEKVKLPTDHQSLWAIRERCGLDPFFEDLPTCHREIQAYMRAHPEQRVDA